VKGKEIGGGRVRFGGLARRESSGGKKVATPTILTGEQSRLNHADRTAEVIANQLREERDAWGAP